MKAIAAPPISEIPTDEERAESPSLFFLVIMDEEFRAVEGVMLTVCTPSQVGSKSERIIFAAPVPRSVELYPWLMNVVPHDLVLPQGVLLGSWKAEQHGE